MPSLSTWPEAQARILRWGFLIGWLLLIVLLLRPSLVPLTLSPACRETTICRVGIGNDLFWNVGLPLTILAVLASHELWRRICPLSFVSQLFRALGWQRTRLNAAGRRQLVPVAEDSWLGRHHVQLQWSLLIAGLSLRLLIANSNGLALALLCLAALLGALVSGWAWSGKAWCHYLCPFGPAQQVITGPRSLIGSEAHLGSGSRITQSMCRTVGAEGREVSTCVACTRPCLDIDAERTYWQTLTGKRGLNWAWASYPGLILAFYLLIRSYAPAGGAVSPYDYLHSNLFTYDQRLAAMAWQSMTPAGWPVVPRLIAVPALLVLGCLVSVRLFGAIQRFQRHLLRDRPADQANEMAVHRTRLLATFTAVNTFFFFKSSLFGITGRLGEFLIQMLIVGVSSTWLYRGWFRDRSLYERESTSTSLRKQLAKLGEELRPILDGRALEDLSPGEVFVLAKALPAQALSQRRSLYRETLRDLLSQGRLERTTSLVKLAELRQSLGLDDNDHRAAIEILASEDGRLEHLSLKELEVLDLRRLAAAEEIEDLLRLSGQSFLQVEALAPYVQERLERIYTESSLDEQSWSELLERYGPASAYSERQLDNLRARLAQNLARRESLARLAPSLPQVLPLLLSLDLQISRLLPPLVDLIRTAIAGHGSDRPDDNTLALLRALSPEVMLFLASEDATTLAIADWLEGSTPAPLPAAPLPPAEEVLAELWRDDDPSVALWALMVQRRLSPERAARMQGTPREGQPDSPTLEAFLRGEPLPGAEILSQLADLSLLQRFEPAVLLDLHRLCRLQQWTQGDPLRLGGGVMILLRGGCEERQTLLPGSPPTTVARHEAGEILGLEAYFGDPGGGDAAHLIAAAQGCGGLVFSRAGFRDLLDISPVFQQATIRDLARTCQSLQRSLLGSRRNRTHERMRRTNELRQGAGGEQPPVPEP